MVINYDKVNKPDQKMIMIHASIGGDVRMSV